MDKERKRGTQGGRTAFTLALCADAVAVRRPLAPAARPMADRRRKAPRRKPDLFAEE